MKVVLALTLAAAGCVGFPSESSNGAPKWQEPSPPPVLQPRTTSPLGVALVTGNNLSVLGVTADGFAVYRDLDAPGAPLQVVPLGGGAPQTISTDPDATFIDGETVFACAKGTPTLRVWNQRHGFSPIDGDHCRGAASPDGEYFLYLKGGSAEDPAADLWVARLDGTARSRVMAARYDDVFAFGGGRFVGASGGSLFAIDPQTARATTLVLGDVASGSVSVDRQSGSALYLTETSGQLQWATLAGAVTTVDTQAVAQAHFGADAQSAIYVTRSGALFRSPLRAPAPMQLVSDARQLDGLFPSPDGNFLLYLHGEADDWNLSLISSAAPTAMPAALQGNVYGPPFTDDSSYFIYYASYGASSFSGIVMAVPVDGTAPVKLGDDVVSELPLAGHRLAWTVLAQGQLFVGEPGGAPTLVASSVQSVGRNGAGDRIIYATTQSPAGIYVQAVE